MCFRLLDRSCLGIENRVVVIMQFGNSWCSSQLRNWRSGGTPLASVRSVFRVKEGTVITVIIVEFRISRRQSMCAR